MRQNGFTLIELLAALAIGSLFLAGLSVTLAGFGDNLRRVGKSDQQIAMQIRLSSLRTILEQAEYTDSTGAILPASDTRLNFRMRPPLSMRGAKNWLNMSLAVEPSHRGKTLALTSTDDNGALITTILEEHIKDISFERVLARPSLDEDLRVANVALAITDEQNQKIVIIVYPRITSKVGCVFDPISQGCRP